MTRQVTHRDVDGRAWQVLLPDGAPDGDASMGIPLGPPPLDALGLPPDIQTRLHNELHARNLLTLSDVERRRADVVSALMAALRIDAQQIIDLYHADRTPTLAPDWGAEEHARVVDYVPVVAPAPSDTRTKIPDSDVRQRTDDHQPVAAAATNGDGPQEQPTGRMRRDRQRRM